MMLGGPLSKSIYYYDACWGSLELLSAPSLEVTNLFGLEFADLGFWGCDWDCEVSGVLGLSKSDCWCWGEGAGGIS